MNLPAKKTGTAQEIAGGAQTEQLENLLAMCKLIGDAIAADITALEKGRHGKLPSSEPEIERLCLLYGREVNALKTSGGIKNAPPRLVAKLKEAGTRLNMLLNRHELMVSAFREASEGLVKTVAQEVDRVRTEKAPYKANPAAQRSPGGAIVYNNVV